MQQCKRKLKKEDMIQRVLQMFKCNWNKKDLIQKEIQLCKRKKNTEVRSDEDINADVLEETEEDRSDEEVNTAFKTRINQCPIFNFQEQTYIRRRPESSEARQTYKEAAKERHK